MAYRLHSCTQNFNPVLATPVMIMAMENAALNALKPYLEPGESALRTAISCAMSRRRQRIVAAAEVTRVEGMGKAPFSRGCVSLPAVQAGNHEFGPRDS